MAKKTKAQLLAFFKTEKGLHKIDTIRNGLISGSIITFPQVFATIAKGNIQTLLGNEFYAFENKINDPGRFTYNEVEFLAAFFQIDFDVMHKFIRQNMIALKKTNKRKPSSKK